MSGTASADSVADGPVRHIVLVRLDDGAADGVLDQVVAGFRGLHDADPGILRWRVEPSINHQTGPVVVVDGLFDSAESLARFQSSPRHLQVAAPIGRDATFLIGDYHDPGPVPQESSAAPSDSDPSLHPDRRTP
jgi:hypothetical protein